jgi:tRNA modification GTPase
MLSFDVEDTIAAIASPLGGGLRGTIRMSGLNCLQLVNDLFRVGGSAAICAKSPDLPEHLGSQSNTPFQTSASIELRPGKMNSRLQGNLLVWPTQSSYTRQPCAEFHTHGAPPLLELALSRICAAGARLANPGEFTLRAFLSGRIDLTQAEAVLSVIDSQAESQLKIALRQLAGGLSGPLDEVRKQLLFLIAEIEAGLDFVEEDLQFINRCDITERLTQIENALREMELKIGSRNLVQQTLRVALIGLPNSGKSTLFNALLKQNRAIVSDQIGTTTDFLTAQLVLDGVSVELIDTAGRESSTAGTHFASPKAIAQRQREQVESHAHIRVLCVDCSKPLTKWEQHRIATLGQDGHLQSNPAVDLVVLTKCDLLSRKQLESFLPSDLKSHLSQLDRLVLTQIPPIDQLRELRRVLRDQSLQIMETQLEVVSSTVVRAGDSLGSALESIGHAQAGAAQGVSDELLAVDLREALYSIGLMVGSVYTDDILDVVFSRFCIGK